MILEIALTITVIIIIILILLYVKLSKTNRNLEKQNVVYKATLEASKAREQELPIMTKTLTADVIKEQNYSFKTLTIEPMNNMIVDLKTKIDDLSKQNVGDRENFEVNMKNMADTATNLMNDTKTISEVLKNSQKRGRHAELGLERVFELSGLEKGIHYDTQYVSEEGKPDFVITLSEDRSIIVDSKAPLDALWKSFDANDEATKSDFMKEHVKAVKTHVNLLSKKRYWKDPKSLDYVVMVMSEYALLPALDCDNNLIEYALEKQVVLATQSTLMILLRAVNLVWKQNRMTDTIKEITALSSRLHERLNTYAEYYSKIGTNLNNTIESYNKGISSWNSRILPSINQLEEASAVANKMTSLDQVNNIAGKLSINDKSR